VESPSWKLSAPGAVSRDGRILSTAMDRIEQTRIHAPSDVDGVTEAITMKHRGS